MKYLISFLIAIVAACSAPKQDPVDWEKGGLLQVEGTKLWVQKFGSGPPLIVVHGGPGFSHDYLEGHLIALADEFELIFYDQRSSGASQTNLDSTLVTLDHFINDIDAIRDAFGFEKIHLLSHSFGGLLAMHYATKYGDRLEKLVFINSIAPSNELNNKANTRLANSFSAEEIQKRVEIMRSAAFQEGDPGTFEELMKIGFRHQFHNPDFMENLHLQLPEDFAFKSRNLQWLGRDLLSYDISESLSEVDSPTLLIYGKKDPLNDFALGIIDSNLADSEVVIFENSGHFPFIEENELCIQSIRQFLVE